MSNSDKDPGMSHQDGNPVSAPKSVSRRSLLKGSVKAMPIVLTLHSGAALARSSNLISRGVEPFAVKGKGPKSPTYCLDTTSVYSTDLPDVYDLGDPASAQVLMIRDRDYYTDKKGSNPISEAEMCEQSGTFFYKDGRWGKKRRLKAVAKPKGMLVSASALTSFAGAVHYVDL